MDTLFNKKRTALLLTLSLFTAALTPTFPVNAEEALTDFTPNNEENSISYDEAGSEAEQGLPLIEAETPEKQDISANEAVSSDGPVLTDGVSDIMAGTASVSAEGISTRSLSSDFTMPAAFLTKKKLTLNGMRRSVSDDTYLVFTTDGEYELSGLPSSGNIEVSVNKLSYNGLPAYKLSVIATSGAAKGSYRYNIGIRNKYNGVSLKNVRLTVAVKKKNPAVKWEKSLITLNKSIKGDFALNSPNIEGVSIVPLSGNKYKPKIPAGINISLQNENTVKISAGSNVKLNKNYAVTLWLLYSDSTDVKAVKRKFNVRVTNKTETISLKKVKGSSLDLSDRNGTALHYKPVIKNTGFVLNDISFKNASISENFVIEKEYDPDTKEITDIYVRAKDGAKLTKGKSDFAFDAVLQAPRMDAKTVKAAASFKAAKKSSKLKLTFVSGNALKINETLSDNHIAGTIELRVTALKYAAIDLTSVKDLTSDKGKIPAGAFKAYWTADRYGQAARIRIVADKGRLSSGKKYNLTYSVKAKGASADTQPTKITVKFTTP